jgi:hypothetical protein
MNGNPYGMVPMLTASSRDLHLRAYGRWEYGNADIAWTVRARRPPRTPVWPRIRGRVRAWIAFLRVPAAIPESGAEAEE